MVRGSARDGHARDLAVRRKLEGEGAAPVVAVAGDGDADLDGVAAALDAGHLDAAVDADVLAGVPARDLVAAGERAAPVIDDAIRGERVEKRVAVAAVGGVEDLLDGGFEFAHDPL